MNTTRNNIIFALVMSLFLGGYLYYKFSKKTKTTTQTTETTSTKETEKGKTTVSAGLKERVGKINGYIQCLERNAGRARQSQERYYSWCAKTGPTGKESNIYGLYTIYGSQAYCDDSEKWAKAEPDMPTLESAAKQYITMLSLLDNLLKEVDKYYSQGDYKDDDMKKGKAFHVDLQVNFEQFFTAEKKLVQAVEAEKKKVVGLPPLPVYPLYQQAQTLAAELAAATAFSPDMLENINTLDSKITDFKLENAEFVRLNAWFLSAMEAFIKNSKEYVRLLRDDKKDKSRYPENKKAYQDYERNKMLGEKNRLIEAYNGIYQGEQPFLKEIWVE